MKTKPDITIIGSMITWKEIFSIVIAKLFSVFTRLDNIEWNIFNVSKITISNGKEVSTLWEYKKEA